MQVQVIPFYGHSRGTYRCFSNFYMSPFVLDGEKYCCTEQWMMACKAKIFPGNELLLKKIMKEKDPAKIKAYGRQVTGYDETIWSRERYNLVLKGIKEKFLQNPELMKILKSTGKALIVEASPYDRIWGVGMSASDINIKDPQKWQGENLLGQALMETRDTVS